MEIAAQHFRNGNQRAFNAQVQKLVRSALTKNQADEIKALAFDIQFSKGV